ncbi:MAG: endonuclease/exonuclease/phosphatase family protein [Anaerolineae bacterium]
MASALLAASGQPGILCGDINATPWSTGRRAARSRAPLLDATLGHGYLGTWPAPLGRYLGIPIDVCLIDPALESVAAAVGPELGSDHRPLTVTLRWR